MKIKRLLVYNRIIVKSENQKFGVFSKNILCSFYFLNHFRKINELFFQQLIICLLKVNKNNKMVS